MFWSKSLLAKKYFGKKKFAEIFVLGKKKLVKNFWVKTFFGQNKIWVKICLAGNKIWVNKKIGRRKKIGSIFLHESSSLV